MTTVVGCKHRAFIRYFGVNIGISGVKIILSVCSITFVVLIGIVECILRKGVFEATGEFNMTQISYMVGINDPRYFSKCFKSKFGITPTEYKDRLAK